LKENSKKHNKFAITKVKQKAQCFKCNYKMWHTCLGQFLFYTYNNLFVYTWFPFKTHSDIIIYAYLGKMRRCTHHSPLYRQHSSVRHFEVRGLYTCVIWSWCRHRTSQNKWSTLSMMYNHRQLELAVVIELFCIIV